MTVYDSKNIEFMWRNVTLTGTGDDHAYSISQQGDSIQPYKGVQGEGLNIINNARENANRKRSGRLQVHVQKHLGDKESPHAGREQHRIA